MKTRLTILLLVLTFYVQAQNSIDSNQISKLTWLTGSWKGMYNGKPFYESWRKFSDKVLVNFSIDIKDKDTVVKEETAIVFTGSKTIFGKKGEWVLKRVMSNEMMFECDTCKFSNRIIFLRTNDDHWFTILQHPKSTMYYDMVRIKELDAIVDKFISDAKKNKK